MVSQVWLLLGKDIRSELRSLRIIPMMVVLTVMLLVVFTIAFGQEHPVSGEYAAGCVWASSVLVLVVMLDRAVTADAGGAVLPLLLSGPVRGVHLLTAKTLFVLALTVPVQVMLLVVTAVLWNGWVWQDPLVLVGAILLGDLGLAVIGVIGASIAAASGLRGAMVPVLVLPLSVPVVLAATQCLLSSVDGGGMAGQWWYALAGMDVLFMACGGLCIETVVRR